MKQFFSQKSYRAFLILFGIFWVIFFGLSITYPKLSLHTHLNSFHFQLFDFFFKYITHLGDGIFAIVLVLLFFVFKNRRLSFYILISFILTSIFVQGLKNYVFSDFMRPYFYIEQGLINVPLVNDVQMHKQHSFPSGHSTTIFALATILSLHFKSYRTGIILFFISIFTAYSRVYLSQHFIQDVLAGSMFGVVFSSIIYIYLEKMKIKQLNNSPK